MATGRGQDAASSCQYFFQPQRNTIALSGGHREIILPWQEEQKKAAFLGRNKRQSSLLPQGQLISHPVTSSSSHMPKARCLSLQEILRSHVPDLEGKAVKHPGALETITSHVVQGWCSCKALLLFPNDVLHQTVQGRKRLKCA